MTSYAYQMHKYFTMAVEDLTSRTNETLKSVDSPHPPDLAKAEMDKHKVISSPIYIPDPPLDAWPPPRQVQRAHGRHRPPDGGYRAAAANGSSALVATGEKNGRVGGRGSSSTKTNVVRLRCEPSTSSLPARNILRG